MQEHIHPAERPGGAVALLAGQEEILPANLFSHPDQQRAGAAGGITDLVSRFGFDQFCQKSRDFCRGVKFTRLFAGICCEERDLMFVNITDDVTIADHGRAEVQAVIRKIFQELFQPPVAVRGLAQGCFAVEIDIPKDTVQLHFVSVFDVG